MRGCSVGDGQRAIDHRTHQTGLDPWPHMFDNGLADGGFLTSGPPTQTGCLDLCVLAQQLRQVYLRFYPTLHPDHDESAIASER